MKKPHFISKHKEHLFTVCLLCLLSFASVNAASDGVIRGTVVDASSGVAVEYADVIVYEEGDEVSAVGTHTDNNGKFSFERIENGNYLLMVRLVGYDVTTLHNVVVSDESQVVDVGTLQLMPLSIGLEEVVVTADRKQIVYKIDKQVISASTNLLASGGSAVDILENTPSIRVDAEGNVTFRGSAGFTVYVNGKPSVLSGSQALEQIPASQIEDIEIITTPSARYDSDGDVGMINIVTKSNFGEGVNGMITASGSSLGSWSGNALINKQSGNNRFYINGNASIRRRESSFDQRKETIVNDTTTVSHSKGPRKSDNSSYYLKTGYEYDNKVTSFLIDIQGGYSKNQRTGDMNYDDHQTFNGITVRDQLYNSYDVYALDQYFLTATSNFERKFNDNGHKITASYYVKHDWDALEYYESNMYNIPITALDDSRVFGSKAYEQEIRWNMQGNIDYIFPYSSTGKIEAGYQFYMLQEDGRNDNDGYSIKFWDQDIKEFVWNDDLLVDYYNYVRKINSLYFIWSEHIGKLEFQVGGRGEYVSDLLDIDMTGNSRNRTYFDFFPSSHISYSTNNNDIFTLSYAYRTNRPAIHRLEPYITYEDYYTAMVGNPDIRAEFTNAFEFTYRKTFENGNTLTATAFHRARKDVFQRIRVPYKTGVTLDSLSNVGDDSSSGIEFNSQLEINRWWDMTINGSGYYYDIKVYDEARDIYGLKDSKSYTYDIVLQNNFAITPTTRIQFDANFVGAEKSSQGQQDPYYYFDMAIRQQLFNRKVNATLNFSDMFRTARYYSSAAAIGLSSVTKIRPRYPLITLTLSYAFNNYKGSAASTSSSRSDLFEGSNF